jgi:hypothetical protein
MIVENIELIHPIYDLIAQFLQPDHTWALFINLVPKFELEFKDLIDFHSDEQTMLVVLQSVDILVLVDIRRILHNEVPFGLGNRPAPGREREVVSRLPLDYYEQSVDDLLVL